MLTGDTWFSAIFGYGNGDGYGYGFSYGNGNVKEVYRDPINGKEIYVKSICRPKQTLLQGMPYHRDSYILAVPPRHPIPLKPLLLK